MFDNPGLNDNAVKLYKALSENIFNTVVKIKQADHSGVNSNNKEAVK